MKLINRTLMIILAIGVAAGSGCVYWRLLKFKRQLDDFPRHFTFHSDSTYTLVSLHPILTGEDVDDVMELAPSERLSGDDGDWRIYAFAKEPPDDSEDLVYRFGFEAGMLTRIEFPAQFSRLYPGSALQELLMSLGGAEVDRKAHAARGRMLRARLAAHLPDQERLLDILGEPTARDTLPGDELLWNYNYRPVTSTRGEKERKRHAYGRFRFNERRELSRVEAGIGKHGLQFDIEDAQAYESDKE